MSRVERRLLIKQGRRSRDPATALRFQAVAHLAAGHSSVRVARELDLARSCVVAIARRYVERGVDGLYDGRRSNGAAKVDARFMQRLAAILVHTPDHFGWCRFTWTRELLCRQMQLEGFPLVAVCTMGRCLARIGARLGMPKPIVLCPWPRDARERKLAELRCMEARATAAEPVLYCDEVDINLNPKIGRDWMLPGHQRRVVTPGQNKKFYIAGGLDVRTGRLITTGAVRKNSALFCEFLRVVGACYARARRVHLILDNYGIHSSAMVKRLLDELGSRIVLHFLPPYCPQANRIERVWQDLHANVTRNHKCKTLAQLLGNARRYLVGYTWRRAVQAPASRIAA
jgi:transposase